MTEHTQKSRGQFQSLKVTIFNSMTELYDREREASIAGNRDLADSFMIARVTLQDELMEIRDAEIAFQTSIKPIQRQIQSLDAAIATAKHGQEQMRDGPHALRGATRVINLLKTLTPMVS